jgi:UDP-N-acetylmuramoylalanine--D-glutamate ligase
MKIAIAGYGVEGEANYRYWSADPNNQLTIVDESSEPKFEVPEGAETLLGPGVFEKLDGFDMVIRTAGLPPFKIKTDGKIWSATNEFFEKCPAQIIGVTGTKGKGTTSTMITAILEAAGKKVWLVGNIGTAALEVLDQIQPDDIVVYELSSFQLWDIERSPHIAVVLGIEPEHLNVHKDMKDYVEAKGRIRRYQTADDVTVYHPTNDYARLITLANHEAPMIRYGVEADGGAYVKDGFFYEREHKICSTDVLTVPGQHNIDNACAAITATRQLHVSDEEIEEGLQRFKGLPHRLAYVTTVEDVAYYDDSIATTPSSAIAALRSFTNPKVIILGGSAKGSDFSVLGHELLKHDAQAIIIGATANDIAAAIDAAGFKDYTIMAPTTMKEVVEAAHSKARPGSVVLLSPSAASFDMFKDYADRGDQFIAAVKHLRLTNPTLGVQ